MASAIAAASAIAFSIAASADFLASAASAASANLLASAASAASANLSCSAVYPESRLCWSRLSCIMAASTPYSFSKSATVVSPALICLTTSAICSGVKIVVGRLPATARSTVLVEASPPYISLMVL